MKTWATTMPGVGSATHAITEELAPGQHAGSWLVERELGRGGMGIVYAVVHEKIGKRAALKILHQRLLVPGFNPERMLMEGRVVNEVGHPNIVDIFETGALPDGRPYIVMERLEGITLGDHAETPVPTEEVFAILLEVCDALVAAHAAGVVHRDLKLDNIFLVANPEATDAPRVKLLDWGIARLVHIDVRHTMDGQLVGTPQYLSPEQARGDLVTAQSDIYSLGVVAFELFLGRLPFEADSAAELMGKHILMAPPAPHSIWPEIPPALESVLLAMLAKTPAERPTAREVAAALAVARAQFRAPPVPDRNPDASSELSAAGWRTRKRSRAPVVIGVLAVAAATGAVVVARGWHDEPRRADPVAPTTAVVPPAPAPAPPPPVPRKAPVLVEPSAPAPITATTPTTATTVEAVHPGCWDPGVTTDGTHFFMTCTGSTGANRFPIYESADLARWNRIGWIFPAGSQPIWGTGNYWAPELLHTPEGVTAYFSMRTSGLKNAIGVATAASVRGPFTDLGAPLVAPLAGASDAHVSIAADGGRYLYYRQDTTPSTLWVQPLGPDGREPRGEAVQVLAATEAWEQGVVEAPTLLREGDDYYLFYSGAKYCSVDYAVGVARSRSPLGPFEKHRGPILTSSAGWAGPGHTTFTADAEGPKVLYHAYRLAEGIPTCVPGVAGDNDRRRTLLGRVTFAGGWPTITPVEP